MNFPEAILIKKHNKLIPYHKQYEHDGGGCYYKTDEATSPVTSCFVSLYPDGRLTFLWDGRESDWNAEWKAV